MGKKGSATTKIKPGDVVRIHGYDIQYYGSKQPYACRMKRPRAKTVEAELHCYQEVIDSDGSHHVLVLRVCFHDPATNLPDQNYTRIPYQLNYPINRLAGIVLMLQSKAPVLFFPEPGFERLRINTIGWFGKMGSLEIDAKTD